MLDVEYINEEGDRRLGIYTGATTLFFINSENMIVSDIFAIVIDKETRGFVKVFLDDIYAILD
jgi:hypothetical protein